MGRVLPEACWGCASDSVCCPPSLVLPQRDRRQDRALLRDAGCFWMPTCPACLLALPGPFCVWAPPQAFLQPPCHPQTRLCLDFRCWVLVGFIFLLARVFHLSMWTACLSSFPVRLLKLALP